MLRKWLKGSKDVVCKPRLTDFKSNNLYQLVAFKKDDPFLLTRASWQACNFSIVWSSGAGSPLAFIDVQYPSIRSWSLPDVGCITTRYTLHHLIHLNMRSLHLLLISTLVLLPFWFPATDPYLLIRAILTLLTFAFQLCRPGILYKKMPKKPWAISSWDPWIKKISLFHHHFWEAKLTLAHLKWGSAKQTQMLKCIAWLTHIWVVLGVSVGKYTIHCASGKMVHQDPKYDDENEDNDHDGQVPSLSF